jgi:adhesin HecA-like repeat protein
MVHLIKRGLNIAIGLLWGYGHLHANLSSRGESEFRSCSLEAMGQGIYVLNIATPNSEGISINTIKWDPSIAANPILFLNNQSYDLELEGYPGMIKANRNIQYEGRAASKIVLLVEGDTEILFPRLVQVVNPTRENKVEVAFITACNIGIKQLSLVGIDSLSLSTLGSERFDCEGMKGENQGKSGNNSYVDFREAIPDLKTNLFIESGEVYFRENFKNSKKTSVKAFKSFHKNPGYSIFCDPRSEFESQALELIAYGEKAGIYLQGLQLNSHAIASPMSLFHVQAKGLVHIQGFLVSSDANGWIESEEDSVYFQNAYCIARKNLSIKARHEILNAYSVFYLTGGKLEVEAHTFNNTTGSMSSLEDLDFSVTRFMNGAASVEAKGKIRIICEDFDNIAGTVFAKEEVELRAQGTIFNNGGTILSSKSLSLSGKNFKQELQVFKKELSLLPEGSDKRRVAMSGEEEESGLDREAQTTYESTSKIAFGGGIQAPRITLVIEDEFKNIGGYIISQGPLEIQCRHLLNYQW